ncbi:hypothetical protein E2562_013170 [Oryza meyeriana var. granulata]|uniref:Uncharacterized protein n=1 Tax=Oryza meyeriana var. granulata TaxID=110450 RepID=A0A6G1DHD7_9ORYZ|nr:hypothetical protein E2562_013170 [Oryza meyeriana var. granulata]
MAVPQKKDNTSDAHSHQSPTEHSVPTCSERSAQDNAEISVAGPERIGEEIRLLGFICGANFGNNGVFVELTLNQSAAAKGACIFSVWSYGSY